MVVVAVAVAEVVVVEVVVAAEAELVVMVQFPVSVVWGFNSSLDDGVFDWWHLGCR